MIVSTIYNVFMNNHKYLYKFVSCFYSMADSTKYFQLTPEILVEYNYNDINSVNNQNGEAKHIIDLGEDKFKAMVVQNGFCSTNTFLLPQDKEHFVLPINKSESRFIQYYNGRRELTYGHSDFNSTLVSQSSRNDDKSDDILIDTFKLHFTSKNYFGDYDGFIISVTVYDKIKNKVGLLSYYIKRTDNIKLNDSPVLINQKLYTTYLEFTIPSVSALVHSVELKEELPGEDNLVRKLFSHQIMDNTPIIMNIYGVKSTYKDNNYEYYNTEKINSIFIPIVDKSNHIEVKVEKATDGDYFVIHPVVDNNRVSFSDYIHNLSDGHPEQYIVFYELKVVEYPVANTRSIEKTTHREQYIINAGQNDNENSDINIDSIMYFRPVLRYSGLNVTFRIDVNMSIINTLDNTTIIKNSSLSVSGEDAKKYGKRMNRIYLGEIPAQINVYNKKPDIDTDGVKITNSSSNVKIENHQHSVIGFIECANVGVSIEQVPKELLS